MSENDKYTQALRILAAKTIAEDNSFSEPFQPWGRPLFPVINNLPNGKGSGIVSA